MDAFGYTIIILLFGIFGVVFAFTPGQRVGKIAVDKQFTLLQKSLIYAGVALVGVIGGFISMGYGSPILAAALLGLMSRFIAGMKFGQGKDQGKLWDTHDEAFSVNKKKKR